jgi:hypothetical protein
VVLLELLGRAVPAESQVLKDHKDLTVHRVLPDLKVLSAHRV